MIGRIIEYSVKNPFLIALSVLVLSVWGYWAVMKTPLDAIPDLSDVQVILYTEWSGRGPNLVEDQITYPLVTAMLGAPKVKSVRGTSDFGFSYVYVIFEDGTDLYWARSRVLEYLSKIGGKLPTGVTPTLGPDATGVGWVYAYALVDESGRHDLAELRSFQDWSLRYALQSVPGVAEVASIGGFVKQYQVNVEPNKLLAYNIPFTRLTQAIRMSNNDTGGRSIEINEREYMVRGRGYIRSLEDLERVPVGVRSGVPILLRDVASVALGPEMRRGVVELDGRGESVGGIVIMRSGENALRVIDRVKSKLSEIEPSLPEGMRIVTTYDRSALILRAIATLKEKLIEITLVVSLVSLVFLFHFRSALVAILSIPLAILLSFIAIHYLGLTSNIMSLGGIAIAIGTMVDAAIVMIENAHRRLEEAGPGASRTQVITEAAKELGKPLFFSLLIIAVSFIPVFTLEAQEGRLFKPLAFTKTFAMLFASVLSITLIPLLMVYLIRGRITPAEKNPINRGLIALYEPAARFVLRFRGWVIASSLVLLALTVPVFLRLGSEFMPPLNEGTILFMPTTLPGISITRATQILQQQDARLKRFPEVERVFGKIGRAETSTDPAPLSMTETLVTLRPENEWRPGMTWDRLISEMDRELSLPGVANIWWMPIQTRTEMQATGVRSAVGIKILGDDLWEIDRIGREIEGVLAAVPGTRSAFSERVTGGYYLDFTVDRQAAARYGLTVQEVEEITESAIGGANVTTTVEGRERYPVNVRYAREFRDDVEKLRRVLVPTPTGAQIPLEQLTDIEVTTGPSMVKDENGSLAGIVFVDVTGRDLGGYVKEARRVVASQVRLPAGYRLEWAGSYQNLLRAKERLKTVIPLTVLTIFVLLYLNFKSVGRVLLVMLTLPFSMIGGILLLSLLHYNLSVAVWVGLIALAGVAAEIGVVMVVYLDQALERFRREGRLTTFQNLTEAVLEGAVRRVRPIVMTASAVILGLLPILWGHGTGADLMKRIAAPMVGGMVTTTLLTLFVIPAVYLIWQGGELRHSRESGRTAEKGI
ncbi:MAG: efflux RND transporter permease subunit [Nitrospirae bacterium]|nr:efflux RND transporter permease subunit [Nitrospirota bacterium]